MSERWRDKGYANNQDRPIRQLEEQLRGLKEKEKYYLKLSQKVKELQDKSRKIKKASQEIVNENLDNQQIERLKNDIDKTMADSKRIEEDNKKIKQQGKSLEGQLKALENVYNNFCNQNKSRRQRLQLRDQQLVEKENEVQSLIQKKNCNQLVIQELKIQISKLQDEQKQLKQELEVLRMQRQEQERQKQRLRSIVTECKSQILQQQERTHQHRLKISQIKEANCIVKQELITVIRLQEKLKGELASTITTYNNTVEVQLQSENKLKSLEDQLKHVEQDLKVLTDQYLKQNQVLKEQQAINQGLNGQIDRLAKEIFTVWQSVRQLIQIQGQSNSDLKTKAYTAWIEVSQILSLK